MFTHVVIWKKGRLKSVSVTNHLQDFLFMILNRLMILNIWVIFLCISFTINQSHLISQNFHIDCDCLALELAFWEWCKLLINSATQVLYMFIMITYMRLELAYSSSDRRYISVCLSLMISAFILTSQYAWWICQHNKSLFLSRWIWIFFSQLMIKINEMITRLTNFNDMKHADELTFTHEHSIFNLLSEEHFASLNWEVSRVSFFRCSLNFFLW